MHVATANLKIFGIIDDCMRVLVPIAHNAHHHDEPDIWSGILFFNDECIANMHHITACTVVQCSVMDDSSFLWEHAIFGPPAHHNPLTDRYEILHN
jgi:hypothetical protein